MSRDPAVPVPRANHWPAFIVGLATLLIFAPLCTHEFTWWDDWATVHQNPALNPPTFAALAKYWTSTAFGLYVPVTYTVWIALASVARLNEPDTQQHIFLNPWIFHAANVLVHVGSAFAAFALLRRLTRRDWPACFGALLFALHPVQVEAVAWVSGLKDVLAGCLAIVALWRYVVHMEKKPGFAPDVTGTLAFVLAMLSKPSAVVVPLIAIGIDWLLIRRSLRRALQSNAVWLLLTIPVIVVGRFAQDVTGIPRAPIWSRPLIMTDALAFYLFKLAWPIDLAPDYARKPSIVIEHGWLYWTWVAPAFIALIIFLQRKSRPWLSAAGWIFLIAILPVSGLATFQFQFTSTVADHYLYVAMLGPALALAFALRDFKSPMAYGATGFALLLLTIFTLLLVPVWQDDTTLFKHNIDIVPYSAVAHNNLGNAYKMHNEPDKALKHFREAMRLFPDFPNAFNNAALVLAERGDWRGAVELWERSVEIRSRLPRSLFANYMEDHNRIGEILLQHGEYQRAIAHFEALLKIKPDHAEARKNLEIARKKLRSPATTKN